MIEMLDALVPGTAGDGGTAGNAGRAAADQGYLADDHRCPTAGTGPMRAFGLPNCVRRDDRTGWHYWWSSVRRFLGEGNDMDDEWLRGLRSWASKNDCVRELWLFGSRAKGCSRSDSDVDIALCLMPAIGNHDWAAGNYIVHSDWKRELEAIVGRHVSLEAIKPGSKYDEEVRYTGALLWTRN
jgi:predicted nucleotidyltransferase